MKRKEFARVFGGTVKAAEPERALAVVSTVAYNRT